METVREVMRGASPAAPGAARQLRASRPPRRRCRSSRRSRANMTIAGTALPAIGLVVGGHRDHEHHARRGRRAHARDRHPEVARRAAARTSCASSSSRPRRSARSARCSASRSASRGAKVIALEHAAARGRRALVARRRDAARRRRRHRRPACIRRAAPSRLDPIDALRAGVAMRFLDSVLHGASRASASPSMRIRANKVRAALTIMGVAVGVFVVVAMSSVVHGINESFASRPRGGGPDVVLRLPAPDRRLQRLRRHRRDLPRAPQPGDHDGRGRRRSSGCRRFAP